ncbi:energy transducer TonB [Salinimicrobium xinjiangense]|uniref:energy transducer TonB n=1 Tax=Salinimicrobium xinjiangense TaxID=438596 RepID=UPI0004907E34|nr:energy transducer TonB [Salinimicrobium xinjiangense]
MRLLLFAFFLLSSLQLFSQDTIYLDKKYKPVSRTASEYFKVLERDPVNSDSGWKRIFSNSGQIMVEEYYSSYKKDILEGKRKKWKKDGTLWTESEYRNGKLDGFFVSYWRDGRLKRKDIYENGEFQEGKIWDSEGNEVPWYAMEIRPEFPGGEKARIQYIKRNTTKPKGIAGGRVVVGFVIDVDGSVTDVEIEESTSPALNLAAYNTVSNMPRWEPGKQDGNPVRVKYSLPLTFR